MQSVADRLQSPERVAELEGRILLLAIERDELLVSAEIASGTIDALRRQLAEESRRTEGWQMIASSKGAHAGKMLRTLEVLEERISALVHRLRDPATCEPEALALVATDLAELLNLLSP